MYQKKVINGYYTTIARYDDHLKNCYYGSCGVVYDGNKIILVSYVTPIIFYDCENSTIEFSNCPPDYSRTTIKHVIAFLKEYIPSLSYQDVKRMWYSNNEKKYYLYEL